MALVINDRVKETTTTTGTGTVTLAGAVSGFETFLAGIGNSNTTYYCIVLNAEFEVGLGTLSGDSSTLARTTIISSSNSDSAVSFSAGAKYVFCCLPASKTTVLDASGNLTLPAKFIMPDVTSAKILVADGTSYEEVAVSGDVSIASGGAVTIANNAVETAMINADAVTGAKIADDAIDSEHYADGSIDNAHIADDAIDSEHYADGSIDNAHIADDAIDSEHYVDGSIDTAHLAADAVTGAKIADDAIDSEHYTDGSIDTAHIAADAITGAKIADDAIDSEHYTDGSIDNAHIADDAIDSEHYAAGSIDTAHIADLNVTTGKIAADAITAAKIADTAISEEHLDPTIISAMSDTTIAAADYLMFWDADDSALKKVDAAELGVGSSLSNVVEDTSPQLGGTLDANGNLIDLNGLADGLVLDTDGDTTISSPTDNQIDFELAGADDFRMTANSFNILSGSTLTVDSGATITNSGTATGFGITRPNAKPIIINGSCQVAQRSSSVAALGDGDEGYVTVDRIRHTIGATSAGRFTSARTTVTDIAGFQSCLQLDCTTADTSIATGELFTLDWRIEGQDLQMAKKGHSGAEAITISFWMIAQDAKVYVIELVDTDNTRHIAQTFTSATSWTRHVLSFAGDTTGKLNNDNGESLRVRMWLHAGATYTGGTIAGSWAATDNANSAVGIGSFFDNTDNDIKVTGMQLEIGSYTTSTIPSFQYESYGENFSRCQRYFQRYTQPPLIGSANANNTMARARMGLFPTTFRSAPTATQSGTMSWFYSNSHQPTSTAFSATYLDTDSFECDVTVSGTGMTATHPCGVYQSGAAYVQFDAEL